jgi:hypothetical protein
MLRAHISFLGAATAVAMLAVGCGADPRATEWVASEVYVVDDRAACMDVTARGDGRRMSVCRDDRGTVDCRGGAAGASVSDADCRAAIRAVLDWESTAAGSGA